MKNLLITALFLLPIILLGELKANNRIAIVVNNYLKANIEDSLNTYIQDLKNEGYDPILKEWSLVDQPNPSDLKDYLKAIYHSSGGLQGAVFIGDLPIALFEQPESVYEGPYPTDHYYMDLEGNEWQDTNGKGYFDQPLLTPENIGQRAIWVSRLSASSITPPIKSARSWLEQLKNYALGKKEEVILIQKYFQKNHEFRTGQRLYEEQTWNYVSSGLFLEEMTFFYDNYVSLNKKTDFFLGDLSKADFIRLLTQNYNELGMWIFHGNTNVIVLNNAGERISSQELKSLYLKTVFLLPVSCYIGNYTAKDYLAGVLVFSEGLPVLTVLATTSLAVLWPRNQFAYPFQEGKNIGESYLTYLKSLTTWFPQLLWIESARVILGDGTLKRQRYLLGEQFLEDANKAIRIPTLNQQVTPSSIIPNINTLRFNFPKFQIFWDEYYNRNNDADFTYRLLKEQKNGDIQIIYEGKDTTTIDPDLHQDDTYYLEYVWNDPFYAEPFTSKQNKVTASHPDSALEYAIKKRDQNLQQYILDRRTPEEITVENLPTVDENFITLSQSDYSLFVAIEKHLLSLLQALLDYGVSPNQTPQSNDYDGASPLIYAIKQNQPDIAALLVAKGATLSHQDNFGKTALDYAMEKNYKALATLLIQVSEIQENKLN